MIKIVHILILVKSKLLQSLATITIWSLATPYGMGDLLLMATNMIIGNISLSVQHSRDEVAPSYSCLLANRFLA